MRKLIKEKGGKKMEKVIENEAGIFDAGVCCVVDTITFDYEFRFRKKREVVQAEILLFLS